MPVGGDGIYDTTGGQRFLLERPRDQQNLWNEPKQKFLHFGRFTACIWSYFLDVRTYSRSSAVDCLRSALSTHIIEQKRRISHVAFYKQKEKSFVSASLLTGVLRGFFGPSRNLGVV